jgi:hypothetical protein
MQDRHQLSLRYRQDPTAPWLICALCGGAVQLVCKTDRRFYFRHMPDQEDRGCPVNTRGKFTPEQILAMKYNGAKEPAPESLSAGDSCLERQNCPFGAGPRAGF